MPRPSALAFAAVVLVALLVPPVRADNAAAPPELDLRAFDADMRLLADAARSTRASQSPPAVLTGLADSDANIAFFVQVSPRTFAMLPRLLRKLWHDKNVYAVHFDEDIPHGVIARFTDTLRGSARFDNVHVMETEPMLENGVSALLNTMSAIQLLLSKSADWSFFINLNASDYPLVDIRAMRRLLGQPSALNRQVNFVHLTPSMDVWKSAATSRFAHMQFDTAVGFREDVDHSLLKSDHLYPLSVRKVLGIRIAKGEPWIVGHRSFCKYAVQSSYARKMLLLMARMERPSEHFFQTLAWNNARFNKTVSRHSVRKDFWELDGEEASIFPYPADHQRSTDETWSFWTKLRESPMMFASNFVLANSGLMNKIDREMSGTHEEPDLVATTASLQRLQKRFACVTDLDAQLLHPIGQGSVPCE